MTIERKNETPIVINNTIKETLIINFKNVKSIIILFARAFKKMIDPTIKTKTVKKNCRGIKTGSTNLSV
jgi:hypothetical protein